MREYLDGKESYIQQIIETAIREGYGVGMMIY